MGLLPFAARVSADRMTFDGADLVTMRPRDHRRIAGREVVAPTVETPTNVVNLMDALRKSLDAVSAKKKTPAKAEVAKPAAKKRARA